MQLQSEVDVPRERAKITGILVGILAAIIAGSIVFVTQQVWDVALGIVFVVGAVSGLITAILVWFKETQNSNETLWKIERAFGVELTNDNYRGEPPKVQALLVNPYSGKQAQARTQKNNGNKAFAKFVRDCFADNDTSGTHWVREGRIGQKEYCEWRDALLAAGYAYKSHSGKTSGWSFNPDMTAEQIIEMALRGDNESDSESTDTDEA